MLKLMLILSILLFVSDDYIIVEGTKYYKVDIQYRNDTIVSGYGDMTIIKSKITFYNYKK